MSEIAKLFVTLGSQFDGSGFDKMEQRIDGIGEALKAIVSVAAVKQVFDFLKGAADAYGEAERQTFRLSNALRALGITSTTTKTQMLSYAKTVQLTTMYQEEDVLSASTLALQLGATTDQLEPLIDAALNLASAFGISLDTAVRNLMRTANGSGDALKRMGISLDEAKLKGGGLPYVLDEIQKRLGGAAQAEVQGYAGTINKLQDTWDDLYKHIGAFTAETVQKAGTFYGNFFNDLAAKFKRFQLQIGAVPVSRQPLPVKPRTPAPTTPTIGGEPVQTLSEIQADLETINAYNASLRADSDATSNTVKQDWSDTFSSMGSYVNTFTTIFGQGLNEMVDGNEDAMSRMVKAFENAIQQMVTTLLAQAAILSIISLIFPGLGSGMSFAGKGASMFGGIWNLFPGFAGGVRNFGGGLALVGERGPELVSMPSGANVYNTSDTRDMLGSSIVINVSGGAPGDRNTQRQLARTIGEELHNQLKRSRRV